MTLVLLISFMAIVRIYDQFQTIQKNLKARKGIPVLYSENSDVEYFIGLLFGLKMLCQPSFAPQLKLLVVWECFHQATLCRSSISCDW